MTVVKNIAVIGAGLAGLSCAQRLQAAGQIVTVFEKSRGVAGRMSSKRGEDEHGETWQCDTGAQYFTARDPNFYAEVQRWLAAGVAAEWSPQLRVFGTLPAANATRESNAPTRFVGTPRMTAPARHLAQTLRVRRQMTVQAIRPAGKQWQLRCAEHDWLPETYDAVILAVPAPQAQPLLSPIHPGFSHLAASTPMRGSWALMLRYKEPLNLGFDAAFVNQGPLRWIAQDSHKPGRHGQHCWLLHACAEWSDAHLEGSHEQIAGELLAAFNELGGRTPDAWTAHRWRYADSAKALALGAAWDASEGLGLCGDWLNGGKVEGAWLSGMVLAQRMLGQH